MSENIDLRDNDKYMDTSGGVDGRSGFVLVACYDIVFDSLKVLPKIIDPFLSSSAG
ncbi:hypothetical protein V6M85_02670 [Sulfolobus tengchongensis]|uniref:Uncharacterized protein n=1 Tax=Sulfolobus tengchongensis TaxID=207809 RepID=A0AAX4L2Z0_9CREN